MTIRPYQKSDAAPLATLYSQLYAPDPMPTAVFHRQITNLLNINGRCWVIHADTNPIGYATVTPVPGLPHLLALDGLIAPAWQRQGWGRRLLQHILAELHDSPWQQLSYCVVDAQTAAYPFLLAHGFYLEHQEVHLQLAVTSPPLPSLPPGLHLRTFSRVLALDRFQHLYQHIFQPHPWYQPYSDEEVRQTLVQPDDLLFLYKERDLIGVAWLHQLTADTGQIEPIGILPAHQGQGYGRFLLQTAVCRLAQRGITQVKIGAWQQNETAVYLYTSTGFQLDHTLIYLAYDL